MKVDREAKIIWLHQSIEDPFWLGWFVGMMEGEGSFVAPKMGARHYANLRLGITDKDTADTLAAIVPGSGVKGPYDHGDKYGRHTSKPIYVWALQRTTPAVELALLVRPHMSERRQGQIDRMVELVGDLDQRSKEVRLQRIERGRALGMSNLGKTRSA